VGPVNQRAAISERQLLICVAGVRSDRLLVYLAARAWPVGGQQLLLVLYVTSYPFLSLILGPVHVGLFSL
jgi:hypothetical protein